MYVFWLQLDTPNSADTIRLLSYQVLRQIAQYLLSPKCAQAFGQWTSDTVKIGGTIDKETIIRTVSQLEGYPELRLYSPGTLPGSLITTTLNLPIGQGEQTVAAHFDNPPTPIDLKRPSSRPPSHDRSRDRDNRSRGNSKDKKNPSL